jgi:hypothetical protein
MTRLVVSVSHAYSSNRPQPKFGPTGRRIRNIESLVQQDQPRAALIRPRILKRMGLLILVGGTALSLAWWHLFNFAH